jgi:hypothetical protein
MPIHTRNQQEVHSTIRTPAIKFTNEYTYSENSGGVADSSLNAFEVGTISLSLAGAIYHATNTLSVTAEYVRMGDHCTISLPAAAFTSTANNSILSCTLPKRFIPVTTKGGPVSAVSNGAAAQGIMEVSTDGTAQPGQTVTLKIGLQDVTGTSTPKVIGSSGAAAAGWGGGSVSFRLASSMIV